MAVTSRTIVYKQPAEKLNLGIDFTNGLQTGEIISNPTVSGDIAGLSITNVAVSGNIVSFVTASGVHGYDYRIEATVDSDSGEILKADAKLYVRDR